MTRHLPHTGLALEHARFFAYKVWGRFPHESRALLRLATGVRSVFEEDRLEREPVELRRPKSLSKERLNVVRARERCDVLSREHHLPGEVQAVR